MNIILLGAPGSGKGTFSFEIIKKYKYNHIAPGDIFRDNIKKQTPLGKKIEKIVNSGNLVSDQLVSEVVKDYLVKNKIYKDVIIDGFPRTIGQAKLLEEIFKELNMKLDAAIYLGVDKDIVLDRLTNRYVCPKCGATYNLKSMPPKVAGICDICGTKIIQRDDDKKEVIETRFENYLKITSPLLKYYQDLNLLKTFKNLNFAEMLNQFEQMLYAK